MEVKRQIFDNPDADVLFRDSERLVYDAKTWLAESLDCPLYSEGHYFVNNGELWSEDGRNARKVFSDAIAQAEEIAADDPSLAFELRRRKIEMGELDEMFGMLAEGAEHDTIVVVSDFPADLNNASENVGGYNIRRKQAYLRVITKESEGHIKVRNQSLDQSDRYALEEIYEIFGRQPHTGELLGQRIPCNLSASESGDDLIKGLKTVYDLALSEKYGGEWEAGMPADNQNAKRGALEFVENQTDIIEKIRSNENDVWDEDIDELMFSVAALVRARFDGKIDHDRHGQIAHLDNVFAINLDTQLHIAASWAESQGMTFSGCGLTLSTSEQGQGSKEFALGYGNRSTLEAREGDKYGSLKFDCPKCGVENTRPRGKLIECCQSCGGDVTC